MTLANADTNPPMTGALLAWDPVQAKEVWRIDQNTFWEAGALTTAGGLLFVGSSDGGFRAFDASNGKQLWEAMSQTGIMAAGMSYAIDGEQYVAVSAGFGGAGITQIPFDDAVISKYINEGRVLAFKLGGSAEMPKNEPRDTTMPPLPEVTASKEELLVGRELYHNHCWFCHGALAASALVTPDLRYMSPETHAAFQQIVGQGIYEARGMASFAEFLSEEEINLVHEYIKSEAHIQKAYEAGGPEPGDNWLEPGAGGD